ncbi:MAG: Na/Pi symporter [Ketobacteraceae bacterium]|nr:Na/Pi symporter [Ketobacteraceae bacterium]
MENIHIMMAGMTAVILFVFGLENFSKEIERLSGERFRKFLGSVTKVPVIGLVIGALVTAIIQSSSATSVIAISLVNAGVLSFKNSLGIIFGANIGTTITAQLIAFKLTAFAPIFIIIGFLMSIIKSRYSIFGKAIFYFGFVFFSLNLISSSLQPLQSNEALIQALTQPQNPIFAILFGCLFTAVVQSSSVTTGLAVIFTQQGMLSLENAVPLIMGANIGTTATALIAMFSMDVAAKKTAMSHFLFNFIGVLMFLPLLLLFGHKLNEVTVAPAVALANIHLVFNVAASVIFIIFVGPFSRAVDRMMGEGKMDFRRLDMPKYSAEETFAEVSARLHAGLGPLLSFLQENYNLVSLSIETNYRSIAEAAGKRIKYIDFFKKETISYFSRVATAVTDEDESRQLIALINQYDYLFQIHDSITDLYDTKKLVSESYVEIRSDILLLIRELSGDTLKLFNAVHRHLQDPATDEIKPVSQELQAQIGKVNKDLLRLLADPERRDASALTNVVTYSQRLKDKLLNFSKISE